MVNIKIKQLLNKKQKSIYWLAKQCNVTYQTMYNIVEKNPNSIKFEILENIMKNLDVELNDILEFVKE